MKYEGFVTPITEGGGGGCLGCFVALIIGGIVIYGIIIGQIRLPFTSGSGPTQQPPSTPQAGPKPQPNKGNPSVSKGNPSVSNRPSTSTVVTQNYQIPSIRADVSAINFFNSGGGIGNKVYHTLFAKSEARYINWDLNLRHPAPGQRTCFSIDAAYYGPDGKIFSSQTKETCIEASSTNSSHWYGKGWNDPGMWQPGTYKVELSIEHKVIASGSFEIFEDARPIQLVMPDSQPRRNEDYRTQRDDTRQRKPDTNEMILRGAQKALEEIRKRKRN